MPQTATDLALALIHAPYPAALTAGCELRDRWPELTAEQRKAVIGVLEEVDLYQLDEWRADWIGDILREGGWTS